jgi:hypothetical protein
VGKRSRKQRPATAPPPKRRGPEPKPWPERPSVTRAKNAEARASRSELKNAAARERLTPLEEGERPLAVTIGAVATSLVILANVVAYAAGVDVQGKRPAFVGFVLFCGLMGAMVWGLWHARYWAVLGLEALLGILILVVCLVALVASTALDVVICVAIVIPAGALFWFLIKAMARIQMPERPGSAR